MSVRSATNRPAPLQPEFVPRDPAGRDAVFRFSVPVLRVKDVATTVAWYRRHFGFRAEAFPQHANVEFAILERDGVQILVRRAAGARKRADGHSGWDLYIWADNADLHSLQATLSLGGEIVRPVTPMGATMAELEVRDPDGYVLCIGGPIGARRPGLTLASTEAK